MRPYPWWLQAKSKFIFTWVIIFTILGFCWILAGRLYGFNMGVVEFAFGVGTGALAGLLIGLGMWELYVKPRLAKKEDK